jgi:hypothetical protein
MSGGVWLHSICDACWKELRPYAPIKVKPEFIGRKEPCCSCGFEHSSGIYLREDPKEMHCRGMLGIHRERQ